MCEGDRHAFSVCWFTLTANADADPATLQPEVFLQSPLIALEAQCHA